MTLYRVRNWSEYFETHEAKRTKRLSWVAVPNKHDGKSYRRLVRLPRAAEIYAAWHLILQVASKAPVRGVLVGDDGPLTAVDLADATGFPEEIFELAFAALTDPRIGWLEVENPGRTEIHPGQNEKRPAEKAKSADAPGRNGETSAYRQDITDRTGQDRQADGGQTEKKPADEDPENDPTKPAEPLPLERMGDDEIFRLASLHVAYHTKDPEKRSIDRARIVDAVRQYGRPWLLKAEQLRRERRALVWYEEVEPALEQDERRAKAARPDPDEAIARQAIAIVQRDGAAAWVARLGLAGTFTAEDFAALLPGNLPMARQIVAAGGAA